MKYTKIRKDIKRPKILKSKLEYMKSISSNSEIVKFYMFHKLTIKELNKCLR